MKLSIQKCLVGGYAVKLGNQHIHNFKKKSEAINFINRMQSYVNIVN